MGLPAGLGSCPQGQDDSGVAAEACSGIYWLRGLILASPDLNPLDYKVWSVLEDMACRKRHNNLESLKRFLVKAAADIHLETVHDTIVDWPEGLKAYVEAEGGHFE